MPVFSPSYYSYVWTVAGIYGAMQALFCSLQKLHIPKGTMFTTIESAEALSFFILEGCVFIRGHVYLIGVGRVVLYESGYLFGTF